MKQILIITTIILAILGIVILINPLQFYVAILKEYDTIEAKHFITIIITNMSFLGFVIVMNIIHLILVIKGVRNGK